MLLQDVFLGKNLRRLRKSAGYSQNELVTKMQLLGSNISRSTYAKIELGLRNLKVTDLIALQQIYSVDFAEFFKGISIS